jgi:hypothetical protein
MEWMAIVSHDSCPFEQALRIVDKRTAAPAYGISK